jgi:hypothetical protein
MNETHSFTTAGGAELIIEPSSYYGQRFSDGHRNVSLSAYNLAGGSYSVFYRPVGAPNFIEHNYRTFTWISADALETGDVIEIFYQPR